MKRYFFLKKTQDEGNQSFGPHAFSLRLWGEKDEIVHPPVIERNSLRDFLSALHNGGKSNSPFQGKKKSSAQDRGTLSVAFIPALNKMKLYRAGEEEKGHPNL